MKTFLLILFMFGKVLVGQTQTTDTTTEDRGYIVDVGDIAPDITIEYLDGKKIKLSDLRGKIVLLQYTASWCSVCRQEMPHLEKEIWQVYKDKGLVFLGIDLKESKRTTKKFEKTMNISYPLTLDTEGKSFYSFATEDAGVTRNVLIDKSGRIAFLTRLYDETEFNALKEKVKELVEAD